MNDDPFAPPIAQLETFTENNSGTGSEIVPDGVKGWSWGGFVFTVIWGLSHRVWLSLLVFVPYLGFLVSIYLGVQGRELAWQNKRWDSIEHFNHVQRLWSIWAAIVVAILLGLVVIIMVIPNYNDTHDPARREKIEQALRKLESKRAQEGRKTESSH